MGLKARLINKAIRKWVSALNSYGIGEVEGRPRPTLILINQTTIDLSKMFGDPTTLPGGRAQRYASSIEVKFRTAVYVKDKVAGQEVALNVTIRFTVTKNKTNSPHRQGEFTLWLRNTPTHRIGEIDETKAVISKANAMGFVMKEEKNKAPYWCSLWPKKRFAKKKELLDFLTDPVRFSVLRGKTLERMLSL